jgi:hypothetical protein
MASIDFPTNLRFQSASFSSSPVSNVYRSSMENGRIKQSRRSQRVRIVKNVQFLATTAQFNAFKTWFKDDAAMGAKYFNWVDPEDEVNKEARIVEGVYTATPLNTRMHYWVISMQFETYEN